MKSQNVPAPTAGTNLRLDWCSHAAAKFAVENWHYSKTMPKSKLVKVGAWENGEFIGCVIFGVGATQKLVAPYGLTEIEGCELVRVALKKHLSPVSRIVAIALRLLKREFCGLRLVVSYADPSESHVGGIYQAGGWVYTGRTQGCYFYRDSSGKVWHPRRVSPDPNNRQKYIKTYNCSKVWKDGKYRYLMPLDAEMKAKIEPLRKPYPKKCVGSVDSDAPVIHTGEGRAELTSTLRGERDVQE